MKVKVTLPKKGMQIPAETRRKVLLALGAFARDTITREAQSKMKSTSAPYIRGLQAPRSLVVTDKMATITLVGALPNALEKGSTPFDLKKGLHGRKYMDVPLRKNTVSSNAPPANRSTMQALVNKARAAGKSKASPAMPAQQTSRDVQIRRMSATSKGWIHPGFKPVRLFPKAMAAVKKLAPRILADYLKHGI